jgi:hypothetical protein
LNRIILSPGITSRYSRIELKERLATVDLVAVDIDECIFPGFSQNVLGQLIFNQIVTRPLSSADLRFVPQLVRGWAYVRKVLLNKRLGRMATNLELMHRYEKSMMNIPFEYFRRGARLIPDRSYPGVLQTLCLLGHRAVVGLVSFGIHLIAEEYMAQLTTADGPCVSFVDANRVRFAARDGARPVFSGYDEPLMTRPADKLRVLEHRMEQYGAGVPLVIGNGKDEVEMAALARERGGISIGFRPGSSVQEHYDLVVRSDSWMPLLDLLRV